MLRDAPGGRTHISIEVAGDPLDPNTLQRTAILEPLTREILRCMEEIQGGGVAPDEWEAPAMPSSSSELKEVIASQLIRWGENLALLIFAQPQSMPEPARITRG